MYSGNDFSRVQRGQQTSNGLALTWQGEVRRNLIQRFQNEPAEMRAWMRQNELRRDVCFAAERDQVQIQGPRLVQNQLRSAAKLFLQLLEFYEK